MDAWELIRALHLLGMAFFVGGQLVLAVVLVPVERRDPDRERMRAAARRFGWGTLVALAVLIGTGAAMASHYDQWDETRLQVKLALVALAGLLIGLHMRRPDLHVLDGAIFVTSLAVMFLGVTLAH